jgi:hypothetical protein
MTLNIEFTPQEEAWLHDQAAQQGIPPAEIIRRLVDEHLPEPVQTVVPELNAPLIDAKNATAIAYLDRRIQEEATDDPEAIRQAEEEVEELKRNLNANRAATGERLVFP